MEIKEKGKGKYEDLKKCEKCEWFREVLVLPDDDFPDTNATVKKCVAYKCEF